MVDSLAVFSEDAVAYSFFKQFGADGKLFFKFHHNLSPRSGRNWSYFCSPEIDVIQVRNDGQLIAYELKGARQHKGGTADYLAFYDAIGQAVGYLDLPRAYENNQRVFRGGAFDLVYIVCARGTSEVDEGERRVLGTVPVGAMLALPDGRFITVKDAPRNPIQDPSAKAHFLENLNTLSKHTTVSRIFQRIDGVGQHWFASR
jgi:hypothetical protein